MQVAAPQLSNAAPVFSSSQKYNVRRTPSEKVPGGEDGFGAAESLRRSKRECLDRFCLRRQMNIELNFPPNFEGLVLGCIDADFCK